MRYLRLNKVNVLSQGHVARTGLVWIRSLLVIMQSRGELVESRSPGPTFKAPHALVWVAAQESALFSQHPKVMPVLMDVRWWLPIRALKRHWVRSPPWWQRTRHLSFPRLSPIFKTMEYTPHGLAVRCKGNDAETVASLGSPLTFGGPWASVQTETPWPAAHSLHFPPRVHSA